MWLQALRAVQEAGGRSRWFQVVPKRYARSMDGGRGELTGERFEGADGLLGNGERVSLAGEDAGEDGL